MAWQTQSTADDGKDGVMLCRLCQDHVAVPRCLCCAVCHIQERDRQELYIANTRDVILRERADEAEKAAKNERMTE